MEDRSSATVPGKEARREVVVFDSGTGEKSRESWIGVAGREGERAGRVDQSGDYGEAGEVSEGRE